MVPQISAMSQKTTINKNGVIEKELIFYLKLFIPNKLSVSLALLFEKLFFNMTLWKELYGKYYRIFFICSFPYSNGSSVLQNNGKKYTIFGKEFLVMFDIGNHRTVFIPEEILIKTTNKLKWMFDGMLFLKWVVCFFTKFYGCKFFFNKRNRLFTDSFPESTPPSEIIQSCSSMTSKIHTCEFLQYFTFRIFFCVFHPFIKQDKRLFFVCWRSKTNNTEGSSVTREMIGPLCLHRNSLFLEYFPHLCTSQDSSSFEVFLHILERFFSMFIAYPKKFSTFWKWRKCFWCTKFEEWFDILRSHIVKGSSHRPSTNDRSFTARFFYHFLRPIFQTTSYNPHRLSDILWLHTTIVSYDFFRSWKVERFVEVVRVYARL